VILLQDASLPDGLPEILLGERRDGGWCIPCGHVEWDEDVESAAKREFFEETGLEVNLDEVFAVQSNFHNPKQHTVGIWYSGELMGGNLVPGGDLYQVQFFPLDNLPVIKFPTDQVVINKLLSELR
jgi:ADP-ribose pyrophosphatase YjhB (NUDIX family)